MHYQGKVGEPLAIEFSDTPIVGKQGLLVAVEAIARDVTKELALQEEVYFQANHDQLTGLFNRYAFDGCERSLMKRIKRLVSRASKTLNHVDFEKVAVSIRLALTTSKA